MMKWHSGARGLEPHHCLCACHLVLTQGPAVPCAQFVAARRAFHKRHGEAADRKEQRAQGIMEGAEVVLASFCRALGWLLRAARAKKGWDLDPWVQKTHTDTHNPGPGMRMN